MKTFTATTTSQEAVPAGNRDFVSIHNNDAAATVYLKFDGSNVALTSANGHPLAAGQTLILANEGTRQVFRHAIYVITASGTIDLRIQGVN